MNLRAGPELDKEMATRIFKLVVVYDSDQNQHVIRERDKTKVQIPPYSTDTDQAYLVVKKFKSKGYEVRMGYNISDDRVAWTTSIHKPNEYYHSPESSTLAESICLAAIDFLSKKKKTTGPAPIENLVSINFPKKNPEKDDDPS